MANSSLVKRKAKRGHAPIAFDKFVERINFLGQGALYRVTLGGHEVYGFSILGAMENGNVRTVIDADTGERALITLKLWNELLALTYKVYVDGCKKGLFLVPVPEKIDPYNKLQSILH